MARHDGTEAPPGSEAASRRRLSVEDRRAELLRACLVLIGARPWDEVSMAEVAAAAGASKPLLYHYFPTKSDLYVAAVRAAAEELRAATTPAADVPAAVALGRALTSHVDWIEANADAYRAILQGGHSSDPDVKAIIEASRSDVVLRLAHGLGLERVTPAQRTVLRGWVGFLEGACLDWLEHRDLSKRRLVGVLTASVTALGQTADR